MKNFDRTLHTDRYYCVSEIQNEPLDEVIVILQKAKKHIEGLGGAPFNFTLSLAHNDDSHVYSCIRYASDITQEELDSAERRIQRSRGNRLAQYLQLKAEFENE